MQTEENPLAECDVKSKMQLMNAEDEFDNTEESYQAVVFENQEVRDAVDGEAAAQEKVAPRCQSVFIRAFFFYGSSLLKYPALGDINDHAQNLWAKLQKRIGQGCLLERLSPPIEKSFVGYLWNMTKHHAVDISRSVEFKNLKRALSLNESISTHDGEDGPTLEESIASDLDEKAAHRVICEEVIALFAEVLNEREQATMEGWLDNVSSKQIAETYGIVSVAAVDKIVWQSQKKLRKHLTKQLQKELP